MTTTNPKLETVRKLLALANDGGATDAEREQAFENAEKLVVKYGLQEALAAAEAKGGDRTVADVKLEMHAPFATEKVVLYRAVAVPLGIDTVTSEAWRIGGYRRASRSDRRVKTLHAFGRKDDLERAELLYTSLLLQQASEFSRISPPSYYSMQEKAAYSRSWLMAYAVRIQNRFEEIVHKAVHEVAEEARANGGSMTDFGMELVLADIKTDVADRISEVYPNLTQTTYRRRGDGGASGREAADRANLGGTGVGNGRAGAIGRG